MLAGACQSGHGAGGFATDLIHSNCCACVHRVSRGTSFLGPGSIARRRLARVIHHHHHHELVRMRSLVSIAAYAALYYF